MLQRFIFANFSEGPPATNRESPEGEGRGTRATFRPSSCGHPPRVAVSFLGLSEKHFPRTPRGKEKVRLLRSGSQLIVTPEGLPPHGLIGYGFFFGWAGVCFGWSGGCVGLCSRTIFPSQEMYALVISSRSFFRLNSISAILCSRVLRSSGICSFLSGLACYREVDSLLRASVPSRPREGPSGPNVLSDHARFITLLRRTLPPAA
jgi:hypothetical protein